MTSHREAPSISLDPAADNTDVYAFVSPNKRNTATLIANYIPFQEPAGGPNFFKFDDNVRYEIKIDNNGDGVEDITYRFSFTTVIANPGTFLYNTGPISFNPSTGQYDNLNVRQTYSVTRVVGGVPTVLASGLRTPPVNIGPRSTPSYEVSLVPPAIHKVQDRRFFAGQRGEGFYVDLGSIFDLGTLRPVQNFHLISTPAAPGDNGTSGYNVHSIAIQVPIKEVTVNGERPNSVSDPAATIGVWATASRQKNRTLAEESPGTGTEILVGPFTQVSRLGNPLINEVVIPEGQKDFWNTRHPVDDATFLPYYQSPELQNLLPVLYPGVFPSLAVFAASGAPRADLVAILLTGVPSGIISGFQNFTGSTHADMLRLNLAIPPNTAVDPNDSSSASRFGILGGDLAGFPNGRRVFDNVTAIELRAIAGVTLPLVTTFTPDAAAGVLSDGTTNDLPYLPDFPYLATPHQGYSHVHTHS